MPRLEDLGIGRCERCGRLFQAAPRRVLCRACQGLSSRVREQGLSLAPEAAGTPAQERRHVELQARELADDICVLTGLSQEAVEQAFRERLPHEPPAPGERRCVRCQKRRTLPDSEFCLYCKVELYSAFGDASADLFQRLELVESEPGEATSVISALEQKRARTASSRINLVGARPVKYWSEGLRT